MKINQDISLTAFRKTDLLNMVLYFSDQAIYQNTLAIPFPYTEQDAKEWLKSVRKKKLLTGLQNDWVIRHREEGLIGGIGFLNGNKGNYKDEIGYWLAKPFWGKGIMTQVVEKITDLGINERGLIRIQAHVFAHNTASQKVLKKVGFVEEGRLKKNYLKDGKFFDGILFAKVV